MHARLHASSVQILTRRGNNWTDKYRAIAKAIALLPARNAYLDRELCGGHLMLVYNFMIAAAINNKFKTILHRSDA
jgi:hypothetical protein